MSDSRFLAKNPEVMKAGRFTKTESNVSLQQKTDTIQRFGVAEFLAAERDTVSVRPDAIANIQRLELTNENRV